MPLNKAQVRRDTVLWKEDVDWFETTYRGLPLSNVLASLLHEFRLLHGVNTPKAYIEKASETFKHILEDRRKEPREDG
jgi:hypothetical protein